jgi:hypothetical protein
MAQYDLLLTQNIATPGVEFSEKYVNISKGGLLSADTSHVPTVLPAGTNGYMLVRDDTEATGLKWVAISAGHTQNTDTGTTNATWTVDSGSVVGKMILDAGNVTANFTTTIKNQVQAGSIILTLPAVTGNLATEAYASGLFASNDALLFKGAATVATINALTTYNIGWTYRLTDAGTCWGNVVEIGDMMTAIVARSGSGNANGDWAAMQSNLDGAVIGPASVTADHIAQFSGISGKLIKDGGVLGTMAAAATGDYVANTLYDANTVLFATSDNTPAALLGTALPPKLWAAVPADKIGTGYSGTAIAGQIAKDANYVYVCETGGTATNQAWTRIAKATNW